MTAGTEDASARVQPPADQSSAYLEGIEASTDGKVPIVYYALHKDKVGDYLRDAINVDVTDSGHLVRRKALSLAQALTGASCP